jgi:hypothetical protein
VGKHELSISTVAYVRWVEYHGSCSCGWTRVAEEPEYLVATWNSHKTTWSKENSIELLACIRDALKLLSDPNTVQSRDDINAWVRWADRLTEEK